MKKSIKQIKNFLLDMDGTIYLGDRLFPGTLPLLEKLKTTGRRAVFLTNNSSMSPEDYAAKLLGLGIDAAPEDIFTSGDAAAEFLTLSSRVKNIYLLGTSSLEKQLAQAGFMIVNRCGGTPDAILLGFDKTLTYEKIMRACSFISKGVPFYATHPDLVCPVNNGFIPDTGSMIKMFEAATGVSPVIIGKPEKPMADAVFSKYGFIPFETAMVGDRLGTDIAFANNAGISAVLVLSGEADIDSYNAQHDVRADFIYDSVTELGGEL